MVIELLRKNRKYFSLILFLVIAYLSYLIVKPFISAILTSFILAYIFHPLYERLFSYTKNKTISSITITLFILLLILLPLIFVGKIIAVEAYNFYHKGNLADIITYFESLFGNTEFYSYLVNGIKTLTTFISGWVSNFLISFPKLILDFFIILFLVFYLFKDWDKFYFYIEKLLLIKQKERIVNHIKLTTNAIVYGFFATAILEAIVATIGFLIFGIPNAFFLGLITIVLVILPFLGAAVIWVPATIWLIYKGKLLMAMLFAIYSLIFVSSIENILRPKIIGDKALVHPAIMLLGIFGGLAFLGFIGIVIGPLILSILYILIKDQFEK